MKSYSSIILMALLFVACSDNISGSDITKDDATKGEATPLENPSVDGWKISGFSQKGPFVTGSNVSILELDSLTFDQTGKIFKSTIRSDEGDFSVSGKGFPSPYAMVQVKGYYRNEITGKRSSGPLTLNAFTDLRNREKVNVNLLTHLEFERVKALVYNGKSFEEAKAQAEREVLAAMAMNEADESFEDLDIFKSGDGNAKLLAISVLMQSNVDVAGLTERVGKFSMELAENGSWKDSATRTEIADWACEVSQRGLLVDVRNNVLAWKISDTLPDFEKFVDVFWADNYGLGICSDANAGDTAVNVNPLSKQNGEKFICKNERWESADKKSNYKSVFGTMTDARDGQMYRTVEIGDQVWMAENLNYDYQTLQTHSVCYKSESGECDEFGLLYPLAAVIDSAGLFGNEGVGCGNGSWSMCNYSESLRGVCPEGWHLPSESEWFQLLVYTGGTVVVPDVEVVIYKNVQGINVDEYGFNSLGGDAFYATGGFASRESAVYWASSRYENLPSTMEIGTENAEINYTGWGFTSLHYVRCVKD